jgi:hypothetical protein
VYQLAGRAVLIAHGNEDTITSPQASFAYATRAQGIGVAIRWVSIVGDNHAMLRRSRQWTTMTNDFVRTIVDSLGRRSLTS